MLWLFVPGDRPDRFPKAAAAGADAVIVDLEDAVAPSGKAAARDAARAALAGGFTACVRINAPRSSDGAADLAALRHVPPATVMIPKCGGADDLAAVRAALPATPLVALVESIAGLDAVDALAAAPGVCALAFGGYDLCAELGARPTPEVLAPFRARVVVAARRGGVAAIDTPFVDLADEPGLRADAARAVDFGFDGKLVIHPKQLGPLRAAFVPSDEELARARAIIEAAGAGGVTTVGTTMIDAPLVAGARRVLARAHTVL